MFLHYRSALGPEERIEIDLNYLFRVPLSPLSERELWQPGALDRPSILSVSLPELLIGKLLALLDRCAARDVWDLAELSDEGVACLESRSFRALFIALAGTLPHGLETYTRERLSEQVGQREVDDILTPMLGTDVSPGAGELVDRAWRRLEPLLTLSEAERDFGRSLHAGKLRLEFLFPDSPGTCDRLARHPALLWKVRNALDHRSRG